MAFQLRCSSSVPWTSTPSSGNPTPHQYSPSGKHAPSTSTQDIPPFRTQPLPTSRTHSINYEMPGKTDSEHRPASCQTIVGPQTVFVEGQTRGRGCCGMSPTFILPTSGITRQLCWNPFCWLQLHYSTTLFRWSTVITNMTLPYLDNTTTPLQPIKTLCLTSHNGAVITIPATKAHPTHLTLDWTPPPPMARQLPRGGAAILKHAFYKNIKNKTLMIFFLLSPMIHYKMKKWKKNLTIGQTNITYKPKYTVRPQRKGGRTS